MIDHRDIILSHEFSELIFLWKRMIEEQSKKNYILSDAFRLQIAATGLITVTCNGYYQQKWLPMFENTPNRIKRLNARRIRGL